MDEHEVTFDKNTLGLEGGEMLNGEVLSLGILGFARWISHIYLVETDGRSGFEPVVSQSNHW
ncbi:hypothetical protein ACFQJD_01395 [Haloplanus sp. GCM10025708]|uniref:hypothetical protein n=1 Tax=Haloferacaceae TaxID=1644056 RepID=UPI0036110535